MQGRSICVSGFFCPSTSDPAEVEKMTATNLSIPRARGLPSSLVVPFQILTGRGPHRKPNAKASGWLHVDRRFMPPVRYISEGASDHSPSADGCWAPQKWELADCAAGELEVEQESWETPVSLPVPRNECEHELKSYIPRWCWALLSQATGSRAASLSSGRNGMMDKEDHLAAFGRKRNGRASVEKPILIRYIHFIFS